MNKSAQTTPEEVGELKEILQKTKSARGKERLRAIIKLKEGRKRKDVANFLDINVKTLDRWQSSFKKEGVKGLLDKKQPGNNRLLSKEQKDKIKTIVESQTPKQMGLEGVFWSVSSLAQLVKKEFNIGYKSSLSYRNLFHYCGFSFHKPVKVNKKRKDGLKKRFETILKKRSDGIVEKMGWYW